MITKRTVLVLGAGTSAPFGYPTGLQLKKDILFTLNNDSSLIKELLLSGFDSNLIRSFQHSFFKSGKDSIDQFLEYRMEFSDLGKILIAHELIKHESEESLFTEGDWYKYVYQLMNSTLEEFTENKLSVITFNYDRSFEHFMFTALQNSYNLSSTKAFEELSKLQIIHLHGQIGNLPWQNAEDNRDYKNTTNFINLLKSSKGIRIIHEPSVSSDKIFEQAKELLKKAEKIIFLGFGYNAINISRLDIDSLSLDDKLVIGTSLGFTDLEAKNIQDKLMKGKIDLLLNRAGRLYKALDFLREFVVLD